MIVCDHHLSFEVPAGARIPCFRARLRWQVLFGYLRRGRECRLAEVRVQEGESIDNALRRFKRKVQTEDIIKEVKRHSFYLKPGAKRRVKQALARKRARKKIRKESD
jgi:small subunit ribosomal protein S21